MESAADGVIRWSAPSAAVALVVQAGVVVDAHPMYVGRWAIGKNARVIWRRGVREGMQPGVNLIWCLNVAPFLSHQVDVTPVQRWRYVGQHIAFDGHLTIGTIDDDNRWYVDAPSEKISWAHSDEASARADVARRLAVQPERWTEVAAQSGGPWPAHRDQTSIRSLRGPTCSPWASAVDQQFQRPHLPL